jgi:plasmid stabilization system protein ParE
MITSISFHEIAEAELNEAVHYYESEVEGLGEAFLSEVEYAVKQIKAHPEASPAILKIVRRRLVRRFPYSVMYSVVDDTIRILAVASQKRRPFYWRKRMRP